MSSVPFKPRYLFNPPEDKLALIRQGVQLIVDNAPAYLTDVISADRRFVTRLSVEDDAFVAKGEHYLPNFPQFAPTFVSIPRFVQTIASAELLQEVFRPLQEVMRLQDMSHLQMRTDAHSDVRAYYKGTQVAADLGEAGAGPVADDLGKAFAVRGTRSEPSSPAPEPTPGTNPPTT